MEVANGKQLRRTYQTATITNVVKDGFDLKSTLRETELAQTLVTRQPSVIYSHSNNHLWAVLLHRGAQLKMMNLILHHIKSSMELHMRCLAKHMNHILQ